MATATTTELQRTYFHGRSRGYSKGGNWVIGPILVDLVITQTVREDGVVCDPSFSVEIDGRHQFGGFARHLPSWTEMPFVDPWLDVVERFQPPEVGTVLQWTNRDGSGGRGTYDGSADAVGRPDMTLHLIDVECWDNDDSDSPSRFYLTAEVEASECTVSPNRARMKVLYPTTGMRPAAQAILDSLDMHAEFLTQEEIVGFSLALACVIEPMYGFHAIDAVQMVAKGGEAHLAHRS